MLDTSRRQIHLFYIGGRQLVYKCSYTVHTASILKIKSACESLTPSVRTGLPAAVSAADLRFALQSLEGVGLVSVTREGTCAGYSWTIKWRSRRGKQDLLQVPLLSLVSVFFCWMHAYLHPASV